MTTGRQLVRACHEPAKKESAPPSPGAHKFRDIKPFNSGMGKPSRCAAGMEKVGHQPLLFARWRHIRFDHANRRDQNKLRAERMAPTPVSEDSRGCPAMHVLQHRTGPAQGNHNPGSPRGRWLQGLHRAPVRCAAGQPMHRLAGTSRGRFRVPARCRHDVKTNMAPRSTGTNSKV